MHSERETARTGLLYYLYRDSQGAWCGIWIFIMLLCALGAPQKKKKLQLECKFRRSCIHKWQKNKKIFFFVRGLIFIKSTLSGMISILQIGLMI